jgi:hypothetical protein
MAVSNLMTSGDRPYDLPAELEDRADHWRGPGAHLRHGWAVPEVGLPRALIALGLITGTVPLLRAAARLYSRWRSRAAAIAVAVAAGILTLVTRNNW